MFTSIAKTKKIRRRANEIYNEIDKTIMGVTLTRESHYSNSVRVNFWTPSCRGCQFHIDSEELIRKCGLQCERPVTIKGDEDLNRIVAGAAAETEINGACRGEVSLSRFSWVGTTVPQIKQK